MESMMPQSSFFNLQVAQTVFIFAKYLAFDILIRFVAASRMVATSHVKLHPFSVVHLIAYCSLSNLAQRGRASYQDSFLAAPRQ